MEKTSFRYLIIQLQGPFKNYNAYLVLSYVKDYLRTYLKSLH